MREKWLNPMSKLPYQPVADHDPLLDVSGERVIQPAQPEDVGYTFLFLFLFHFGFASSNRHQLREQRSNVVYIVSGGNELTTGPPR